MKTNLTGKTFGFLTVVSKTDQRNQFNILWQCVCICGKKCLRTGPSMRRVLAASCGCQQPRLASEANKTHGMTKSAEYSSWTNMLSRCRNRNNPRFKDYGGRGISVCKRWLASFEAFFADMGAKPAGKQSLEREDNNGNYCPSNCYWATHEEQHNNTRSNAVLVHNGKSQTIAQWARETGIRHSTIQSRTSRGWTAAEALTTPVSKSNKLVTLRKSISSSLDSKISKPGR